MLLKWPDQPMQVYRTANGYLGKNASAASRTPPAPGGLPRVANIYKNLPNHMRLPENANDAVALDYPKIVTALRHSYEAVEKAAIRMPDKNLRCSPHPLTPRALTAGHLGLHSVASFGDSAFSEIRQSSCGR
jgi:hypothetical protein